MSPHIAQLNDHIIDCLEALRQILGEHIMISTSLAPDLRVIQVDRDQLRVAIMHIATRARDAMPKGGRFLVETCNVVLDECDSHNDLKEYVQLSLTYSGAETRPTDPSSVYAFVAQAGGRIERGATVSFCFPARASRASPRPRQRRAR
jgi:hypothetical protein